MIGSRGVQRIVRQAEYIQARLAFVSATFNMLLDLFHNRHPAASPFQMGIAEFSL
jgi:hypothetical protein